MKKPLLSVIVPVYNVAAYLAECLQSLAGQTLRDIEVILVDDGSTDDSGDICTAFVQKDTRFKVVRQSNLDLAGARNTGLKHAAGQYVSFLDIDDFLDPQAYEKLCAIAEKTGAQIVFCAVKYYDDQIGQIRESDDQTSLPLFAGMPPETAFSPKDLGANKIFSYDSFVVAWNKVINLEFLRYIKANFPTGLIYEDNSFYFKTILNADKIAFTPQRLINYRINRHDSIIGKIQAGENLRNLHIAGIFYEIMAALPTDLSHKKEFSLYCRQEFAYKFDTLPFYLRDKYLNMAKCLLLPDDFQWLKRHSLIKQLKKNFSWKPVSIERGSGLRSLKLFGQDILSAHRYFHKQGYYDCAILFAGAESSYLDIEPGAPVLEWSGGLECLWENLDYFLAQKNEPVAQMRIGASAALKDALQAIYAIIYVSRNILIADAGACDQNLLERLYYRLNCVFPEKHIHIAANIKAAGKNRLREGIFPLSAGGVLIRGKKARIVNSRNHYGIRLFGIPVGAIFMK